jgi:hypothetical protein
MSTCRGWIAKALMRCFSIYVAAAGHREFGTAFMSKMRDLHFDCKATPGSVAQRQLMTDCRAKDFLSGGTEDDCAARFQVRVGRRRRHR